MSKRRLILLIAIALIAVILITIVAAPNNTKINSGSTYGRAPDGYGAWYAFMTERGTPVQRWQKPFEKLIDNQQKSSPITLLQIYPQLVPQTFLELELQREWVEKGNTLVVLGVLQPVTEASFSTLLENPTGKIKIDTRRRQTTHTRKLLGDRFGAVVWQENIGKGKIIYAVTPHLAANAYQDFRSNYQFLAQVVTKEGNTVWVDEYLHGYKDKEVIEEEIAGDIVGYLAKTPLFPVLMQVLIVLLVAIWIGNSRFGKPNILSTPTLENSEAYIQALAGVLQKAKSKEFMISAIAKDVKSQQEK